jgi:hypothetical protein
MQLEDLLAALACFFLGVRGDFGAKAALTPRSSSHCSHTFEFKSSLVNFEPLRSRGVSEGRASVMLDAIDEMELLRAEFFRDEMELRALNRGDSRRSTRSRRRDFWRGVSLLSPISPMRCASCWSASLLPRPRVFVVDVITVCSWMGSVTDRLKVGFCDADSTDSLEEDLRLGASSSVLDRCQQKWLGMFSSEMLRSKPDDVEIVENCRSMPSETPRSKVVEASEMHRSKGKSSAPVMTLPQSGQLFRRVSVVRAGLLVVRPVSDILHSS